MEDILQRITLQRFAALLVQLGGVKGTLAVAGAFALHLDPFGSFHVSWPDALVALSLAAPIMLADAALMLPEWPAEWDPPGAVDALAGASASSSSSSSSGRTATVERAGGLQVLSAADILPLPRAAAAGAASAAAPRSPGRAAAEAAALFQRIKVGNNPAEGMAVWQEGALILVGHLADEMFARALILGGLTAWLTDRASEADLDPTKVEAYAPAVALGMVLIFETGRKRRALFRQLAVEAAVLGRDKVRAEACECFVDSGAECVR